MKKLEKYLRRNKTDFRPVTMGNDYFFGIKAPKYKAMIVMFDYRNGEQECKRLSKLEKKIESYCSRYGYMIYNRHAYPGLYSFFICRPSEYDAYEYYQNFVDSCREECEQLRHEKGLYPGLNEDMKSIMKDYENGYREFLKATAAA